MSAIVSATTSTPGRASQRASFVSRASVLLRDATAAFREGNFEDALELGYQAALRTAGAYIAGSTIASKRRLPKGAWAQLRLVDDRGAHWAKQFESFSTLRSRVMNSLPVTFSPPRVAELLNLVGEFLDEVEHGIPPLVTAA